MRSKPVQRRVRAVSGKTPTNSCYGTPTNEMAMYDLIMIRNSMFRIRIEILERVDTGCSVC